MKLKSLVLFLSVMLFCASCSKTEEEIHYTPHTDVQVLLWYMYSTLDEPRDSLKWVMEDVCHYSLIDSFEIPYEEDEINFDYGIIYKAHDNISNNDGWWTFYINDERVCTSSYEHEGFSENWKDIIRAWTVGIWVDHYTDPEEKEWCSGCGDSAYWDNVNLYLYDDEEEQLIMQQNLVKPSDMINFINTWSEHENMECEVLFENDMYFLVCHFGVKHSQEKSQASNWYVATHLIHHPHEYRASVFKYYKKINLHR